MRCVSSSGPKPQLRQPGLDGPARNLQAPRDLHEADAGLVAKERDEAGIKLVHRTGHIAYPTRF